MSRRMGEVSDFLRSSRLVSDFAQLQNPGIKKRGC